MRFVLASIISISILPAFADPLFEKRSDGSDVTEWSFRQKLHSGTDAPEFQQRLFVNSKDVKDSVNAPILIELCGEWECHPMFSSVVDLAAKKHAAYKVKIEHRFYGTSHPFAELTNENLRYLSTEHALGDLVRILEAFRSEWNWQGPIIPIGCSYAGNLAAYLRSERPDLAFAAVAASAPVRAQALLPEKDTFNTRVIGTQCASVVRKNVREFENFILGLTPEEFRAELPKLDIKNTDLSLASFINLLGDWTGHIVNNDDYRQVCRESTADSLEGFLDWFKRYNRIFNPEKNAFEVAAETSVAKIGSAGTMRQWLYQTCSEYGYFQITEPVAGIGPLTKDASSKLVMCEKLFGIRSLPNTDAFNARYYEPMKTRASKIIFANTATDFWTLLSLTPENNTNLELLTFVAETGRHCSALKDIKKGVPGPGAEAILNAIGGWL